MIRKSVHRILRKVKVKAFAELEMNIAAIGERLNVAQTENNRLVRELIIEQRKKAGRNLFGGVFNISDKEVATKIFNDSIMYLDPRDIAVVPHIVLEGVWERPITMAWLNMMEKRDLTVLDIGANFGYFGMLAAQRLDRKESKIVLFEANPNLLPYIHKTLSVNWLNENTVVENLAVSDENGKAKLNVLQDYTGSSSIHTIERLDAYLSHKMHIKAESVIEVNATTIDSYCEKNSIDHVDLIKMDIEGYEEKAYQGMKSIINVSPEVVMFLEFTKDGYDSPEQFFNQMVNDFGHVYTIDGEGMLVKPSNNTYETVIAGNNDWIMLVFSKKTLIKLKSIKE